MRVRSREQPWAPWNARRHRHRQRHRDDPDWSRRYDLLFLSCLHADFDRARQIADYWRQRGALDEPAFMPGALLRDFNGYTLVTRPRHAAPEEFVAAHQRAAHAAASCPPLAASSRRIALEQVRMLYHHMSTSIKGTLFGAVLLVLMMWSAVPHGLLLAWLAAMSANQGWRQKLYRDFRRQDIGLDDLHHRTVVWAIGAGLSGVLWAAANMLFFVADSPLHQTMLFTLTFAIVSVAVPLVASHLPSLHLFVTPVLLSFILRNAWEADAPHLLLACVATAAMIGILAVGRRYHELLTASQRARFENETLAVRLAQQNTELEAARNVAEKASVAKSKFLAAASHDLRQPLHALMLFANALNHERDPAQVASLAQHIGTSVSALEMLFNSLLDISKLDAGVVQHRETDFRLEEILERVRNDFEPVAALKRLRLTIRATPAVLRTDAVLLEQMLRNLMTNAMRYTETGGILLACRRRGGRWRIEVRDSGIGIAADHHQKIFDEFYQIGNPERDRQKGLGLGLAIVSRLSRLLGCPLELASQPGCGTMIAVTVPEGKIAGVAPAALKLDICHLDSLRVLIVDDEAEVRVAMETIMRKWGCDTLAAESLVKAVAAMRDSRWEPELAISDYRLKDDASGIDVLDWLREQYGAQLPCLLITGDTEADRLKAVRESGYALLHKPIPPAKLRAVLGSLVARQAQPAPAEK
ncbi:MAG: hybrid sensor histidine kinase/response regulator [Rhodocyclaceae bacterium]|nr:hybrid sensor histidine kinase/response regulator [Rhodocyclaceae bacterium]